MNFTPEGVIAACLLPFDEELRIDAAQFKRHLASVAAVEGISAITLIAPPPSHGCSERVGAGAGR
jgi:4-hydroxy-tetrahydrodipicolinate synthase